MKWCFEWGLALIGSAGVELCGSDGESEDEIDGLGESGREMEDTDGDGEREKDVKAEGDPGPGSWANRSSGVATPLASSATAFSFSNLLCSLLSLSPAMVMTCSSSE
jgi:hypothetical protein